MRVGLVIPALDEEAALPLVLAELPPGTVDRVVVVDNGSRDGTARVAAEGGAQVVAEPRRGYGSACLKGLEALLEGSFGERGPLQAEDIVVFLDADHSDYPSDLPLVIAPIREGRADLVIGSRILGGATMEALLPQAWFGNRLACSLMWLFFGAKYSDLGPFRAITVHALRHLRMADAGFGWTVEMQLKAASAKLRVEEVPVRYRKRIGESKITGTVRGTLLAGTKILGWILTWRVRHWSRRDRIPTYRRPERAGTR